MLIDQAPIAASRPLLVRIEKFNAFGDAAPPGPSSGKYWLFRASPKSSRGTKAGSGGRPRHRYDYPLIIFIGCSVAPNRT
ncbi:hypothetical protein XI08_01615 [Bradyrhizobium sp. CCBAU 11361]|nr:hypothetical protein [Bradyrhizobium sp. CCBAU 11361]